MSGIYCDEASSSAQGRHKTLLVLFRVFPLTFQYLDNQLGELIFRSSTLVSVKIKKTGLEAIMSPHSLRNVNPRMPTATLVRTEEERQRNAPTATLVRTEEERQRNAPTATLLRTA